MHPDQPFTTINQTIKTNKWGFFAHLLPSLSYPPRLAEKSSRANPTPPSLEKNTILDKHGLADAPGDEPGRKAIEKGSLTGLVIARHGTGETAFGDGDVEMLRDWFEGGGAES